MKVAAIDPVRDGYFVTVMDDTKVLSHQYYEDWGRIFGMLDHFNVPPHRTLVDVGYDTTHMNEICKDYGFIPCKCVSPKSNEGHRQGFDHRYTISTLIIPLQPTCNQRESYEDSINMIKYFIGD